MFRLASRKCYPIFATCKPLVQAQASKVKPVRNLWDLARPTDFRTMVREMDRQMERFEREIFDHFPLRKLLPRTLPIEGADPVPYRVNIDVSGFKPEEINVSVKGKCLTIRAKMERGGEDGSKFFQEVSREMSLPENVHIAELRSFLNPNGVLVIEAPFQPPEKPKEIPVSSESKTAPKTESKNISSS